VNEVFGLEEQGSLEFWLWFVELKLDGEMTKEKGRRKDWFFEIMKIEKESVRS